MCSGRRLKPPLSCRRWTKSLAFLVLEHVSIHGHTEDLCACQHILNGIRIGEPKLSWPAIACCHCTIFANGLSWLTLRRQLETLKCWWKLHVVSTSGRCPMRRRVHFLLNVKIHLHHSNFNFFRDLSSATHVTARRKWTWTSLENLVKCILMVIVLYINEIWPFASPSLSHSNTQLAYVFLLGWWMRANTLSDTHTNKVQSDRFAEWFRRKGRIIIGLAVNGVNSMLDCWSDAHDFASGLAPTLADALVAQNLLLSPEETIARNVPNYAT